MTFINEYIYIIAFCAILIILALLSYYVNLKDKEAAKRLARYEKTIEDINREMHRIQKGFKDFEAKLTYSLENINALVEEDSREIINEALEALYAHINELQNSLDSEKSGVLNRILLLEDKVKELVYVPSSSINSIDEKKIVELKRQGLDNEAISKKLRISKSEVEFTLKLANL